jgi:dihydrofolate reductase
MVPKILFLHGFAQNGSVFARKASGLRKALSKLGYETVFLDAPIKIDTTDLPFESLNSDATAADFRSWWPHNVSTQDHYTIDQALESIKESINTNGPYDGIVGFSQGAGFAGLLLNIIHQLAPEKQNPFKFAVLYSGFRVQPEALQHYYTPAMTTPSLHILGSLDTVVSEERTLKLFDACAEETRTLLRHPGGHFVPNAKPYIKAVTDFIQTHAPAPEIEPPTKTPSKRSLKKEEEQRLAAEKQKEVEKNDSKPEEKKDDTKDEWDEFDKIGQA